LLLTTSLCATGCGEVLGLDGFESFHGGTGPSPTDCVSVKSDSGRLFVITQVGQSWEPQGCPAPTRFGSGNNRVAVISHSPGSGKCRGVTELTSSAPLHVDAAVQAGYDAAFVTGLQEATLDIGPPCGLPDGDARQLELINPGVPQMFLARVDYLGTADEGCVRWAQPISYPDKNALPRPAAVGVSEEALALVGQLGGAQATAHGSDGVDKQLDEAGLGVFVASYGHCGEVSYLTGFGKGCGLEGDPLEWLDRADGVYLAESIPIVSGTLDNSIVHEWGKTCETMPTFGGGRAAFVFTPTADGACDHFNLFGTTENNDLQVAHDVDGCFVTGLAGTGEAIDKEPRLPNLPGVTRPSAFVSHTCEPKGTIRFGNEGDSSATWGARVVDIGQGNAVLTAYVTQPNGAMLKACTQGMACNGGFLNEDISQTGFLIMARVASDGTIAWSGAIGPIEQPKEDTGEGFLGEVRNNLVKNSKGEVFVLAESPYMLDLQHFDCPDLHDTNDAAQVLSKLDLSPPVADPQQATPAACEWGTIVKQQVGE